MIFFISAKATSAQPSTQAVTPAATTVPADSKLEMKFALNENFKAGLETPGSDVFVNFSTALTSQVRFLCSLIIGISNE